MATLVITRGYGILQQPGSIVIAVGFARKECSLTWSKCMGGLLSHWILGVALDAVAETVTSCGCFKSFHDFQT